MADPSRSEPATPRRRREARDRGQVARSGELTSSLLLLALLLFFRYFGGDLLRAVGREGTFFWGGGGPRELDLNGATAVGTAVLGRMLVALAPLLVTVVAVAILVNLAQVGVLFTATPLTPRPETLNPFTGFGRVFSQRTGAELLKAALKLALIAWVVYTGIAAQVQTMTAESLQPVDGAFATAADLAWRLGLRIVLVLLALAILDYAYQRYEYERSLRMTRQEVKDEFRQQEGDPLVKARIRQLQREASRRRMISEIPKADVVITNPMHLAVAIRYDPGAGKAPRVLAKGARLLASRIKEIAREHRVPVYEDPPLAQALYGVPVGSELPGAVYHAVAQVLAFVYHTAHRDKEAQVLGGASPAELNAAGLAYAERHARG